MGKNTKKLNKGFTLIELLLIIGLVAILGVMGAGVGGATIGRSNVRGASERIETALNTARSYSMAGREDSSWGVNIAPNIVTTYKGTSFATRDTAWDEEYQISSVVTVTNDQIIFSKITGEADAAANITVSGPGGIGRTVTVSALGVVEAM